MIRLIVLGKIKDKNLEALCDKYINRIKKYHKLEVIELKDYPDNVNSLELEEKEILKYIDSKNFNILLDLKGDSMNSIAFSDFIDKKFINYANICFFIGSSNGFSNKIKQIVNKHISFSKMTFTHQMFRLMLLEQIYRNFKIKNNERYHK